MNFIDFTNDPFSKKWLGICQTVYDFYYHEYTKACDKNDYDGMKKAGAGLLIAQQALDKAWKDYNEEIGDGIDWEKIYEEEK